MTFRSNPPRFEPDPRPLPETPDLIRVRFDGDRLPEGMQSLPSTLANPAELRFTGSVLQMAGRRRDADPNGPALIGRRLHHGDCAVIIEIDAQPPAAGPAAGLVFLRAHGAGEALVISGDLSGGRRLELLERRADGAPWRLAAGLMPAGVADTGPLGLAIEVHGAARHFLFRDTTGDWRDFGQLETKAIVSDSAATDFIGFGVFARRDCVTSADIASYTYVGLSDG